MTQTAHPTLKERLHGIAIFLPKFEDPDFFFGEWPEPKQVEPGVISFPYFSFSDDMEEFIQTVYDYDWIMADFNWVDWSFTREATRLRDDPCCMARATPVQLSRLLTVVILQERFCDDALESAYESGLLTAICRRAAQLESETDVGKE